MEILNKNKIKIFRIAFLIVVLVMSVFTVACNEDKVTEYDGVYSGTYSGNDNGTWKVTIIDGEISSSSGYSRSVGNNFSMSGSVSSSGLFTATASTGAKFSGQFSGDNVSGTWNNGNYSGIFSEDNVFSGSKE